MQRLMTAVAPYKMHLLAIWSIFMVYLAAYSSSSRNCSFFNPFCVCWDTSFFWQFCQLCTFILLCYVIDVNPWASVGMLCTSIGSFLASMWN